MGQEEAGRLPDAALTLAGAEQLDRDDPLGSFRAQFAIPPGPTGEPSVYLCGNSLGLMPRRVPDVLAEELDAWRRLAVRGHFEGPRPWYSYHELFVDVGARLVGARPGEVVMMNSLTVNLHLMLASFYRPAAMRSKILIESTAFPSDRYAVSTHVAWHGLDPSEQVVWLHTRPGENGARTESVLDALETRGSEIAVVLLGAVDYLTGEALDIARIAEAGHRAGCYVGFDLAHAAGNLVMALHDADVDFAVWCSYKYLNAGPGAVAGCFVHERHGLVRAPVLPRLAGWWGNDPQTRFAMHRDSPFTPQPGAAGWQLSNPPILALAPLRPALELFDSAGMHALRAKSVRLTGYLEAVLGQRLRDQVVILTPADPDNRGCQLSLRVRVGEGRAVCRALAERGFVIDFREPDVVRVAPAPLYNTFRDVWSFAAALEAVLDAPHDLEASL